MLKLLLGLGLALLGTGLLGGCSSDPGAPTTVTTLAARPEEGGVILNLSQVYVGADSQNSYGLGIYLANPATGAMQFWAISRALTEPESIYATSLHGASWSEARGELLIGARIGDKPALFAVGRDGRATDLRLRETAEAGPLQWFDYAWSPDGRQIAYNKQGHRGFHDPDYDVYVQEASGSPPRRVSQGLHGRDPAWSPDGAHLAFSTFQYPSGIYRVPAAGGEPRLLVSDFRGASAPAWSPDGTSIAFLGRRAEADPVNLWVMDAEGGGLRAVVPLPAKLDRHAEGLDAFAWSPDGRRFVVLSDHAGPCTHNVIEGGGACRSRLHLVNADGSNLARLGDYTQWSYYAWLAWIP